MPVSSNKRPRAHSVILSPRIYSKADITFERFNNCLPTTISARL